MNVTRVSTRSRVTLGDTQVASQVGLHLLGQIADWSGLPLAYSEAVPVTGERAPVHDRGRMLAQVAVMLAGGGECLADVAALRDQPVLFGEVASGPTLWRAITSIDESVLAALRAARTTVREKVWADGGAPEEVVLDVDGTLVEVHSEHKEGAAAHFKGGFGFHPMTCFLDETGEALAGVLRPGNAAANSGADQLEVVDLAIAQLPPQWRAGHGQSDRAADVVHPILVRADTAGAVKEFVEGLVARNLDFSVGARVNDQLNAAVHAVAEGAWVPAIDGNGEVRDGAFVAELDVGLAVWPEGTRAIARRERPHPGAQLRLWDTGGWRYQVVLTNQEGDPVELELRHRRHAAVENRIKALKDTGADRMPFTAFAANAAWFELCLAGADLLAWCRVLLLDGELARATPKTLRYRLLHVAARVIRSARRLVLRLP